MLGPRWRLARLWRSEGGVSAVEFGLIAPILFFALVATADFGLALNERMSIDHVLRAGAQSAMADEGVPTVRSILEGAAAIPPEAPMFPTTTWCSPSSTAVLDLCAAREFACPEAPGITYTSLPTCSGSAPANIYYRMEASKQYDGLFLPISLGRLSLGDIALGSTVQVQVR